jgi:hypothetical protein
MRWGENEDWRSCSRWILTLSVVGPYEGLRRKGKTICNRQCGLEERVKYPAISNAVEEQ